NAADAKEALNFVFGTGGPLPDPDPTPPPPPVTVTVTGNVQALKDIPAGLKWMVDTSKPVQAVKFGVNGNQHLVTNPGTHFEDIIPNDVTLGNGNCEITAINADGSIAAHYGPFPVNFIPNPNVPVETRAELVAGALLDIENEWIDLHSTTVGLSGKNGYPAPHWKNAHDASERAKVKIAK